MKCVKCPARAQNGCPDTGVDPLVISFHGIEKDGVEMVLLSPLQKALGQVFPFYKLLLPSKVNLEFLLPE